MWIARLGARALTQGSRPSIIQARSGLSAYRAFSTEQEASDVEEVFDDAEDETGLPDFPYPPEAYESEIAAFAKRINLEVGDIDLLKTALAHKSVAGSTSIPFRYTNQRLEVLGRYLLPSYVAEHLYERHDNLLGKAITSSVGQFTSTDALYEHAERIGLRRVYKFVPDNADKDPSDPSGIPQSEKRVLAAGFKALLGAVHAANGPDAARAFVHQHILADSVDVFQAGIPKNPRNRLRDHLRREGKDAPRFEIVNQSGLHTHAPVFLGAVYSGDVLLGEGTASSKQKALQNAALNVLAAHYGETTTA